MNKSLIFLSLLAIGLTGCGEDIKAVSYYHDHIDEATAVVNKCKLGEITNDNCVNAQEALHQINKEKIRSEFFR